MTVRVSKSLAASLASQQPKPAKGSKYGNKRVEHDGHWFASAKERDRYVVLKLRLRLGQIRDLKLQPRYPLSVCGLKVCTYVADFEYVELPAGDLVVEDVKGFKTDVYKLKAKLFEALHGFPIREV